MAIQLNDNIEVKAPKPSEYRYFHPDNRPWLSVAEVNSTIPSTERHPGLVVFVVDTKYIYKDGIADTDLILDNDGGSQDLQSVLTNGEVTTIRPEFQDGVITNEIFNSSGDDFVIPQDESGGRIIATREWVADNLPTPSVTFTDLTDTPSTYTGQSGKKVVVNAGETALEFVEDDTNTQDLQSVTENGNTTTESVTIEGSLTLGDGTYSYLETANGNIEDDGGELIFTHENAISLNAPQILTKGNSTVSIGLSEWNATTNTPALANTDINKHGLEYPVSVAGTQDFGAGDITFGADDIVANNGTIWYKKVNNNQGGGGVTVHNDLTGRDATDAHPISSITDLQTALDSKLEIVNTADIVNGAVTNTKFRNSTAHTVVGRAGSGNGSVADIGLSNNTILGRQGSGSIEGLSVSEVQEMLEFDTKVDKTQTDLLAPNGTDAIALSSYTIGGESLQNRTVQLVAGDQTITLDNNFKVVFQLTGTGVKTFTNGAGRTIVQVNDTLLLNGDIGSKAIVSGLETVNYLEIRNR